MFNEDIWVEVATHGNATIVTGKAAPANAKKVSGPPDTIKAMLARITERNGGSAVFAGQGDADGALDVEHIARLANV